MSSIWSNVPVTSLAVVRPNYILAGQGHSLVLLDVSGNVLDRLQVFKGANVHHIVGDKREDGKWLVAGAKCCAIVRVLGDKICVEVEESTVVDWIMHCLVLDTIYILTAHNRFLRLDKRLNDVELFTEAKAGHCILYCGLLLDTDDEFPLVMAGTVTGEVLVWRSDTGDELHKLRGHDGVIFSVNYSSNSQVICSTSDDRSARVYSVIFTSMTKSVNRSITDWSLATITCIHSFYGHQARVFRSLLCDSILVTVGEDGNIISWSLTRGEMLKSNMGNNGSAVWSVVKLEDEVVLTGGGDGSIARWDFGDQEVATTLDCRLSKPRVVKCIMKGRVLIIGDDGDLVSYNMNSNRVCTLYTDTSLSSYSLLSVSKDTVVMCGLTGQVVAAKLRLSDDVDMLEWITKKHVIEGKIFACAVYGEQLLVNGCEGKLVLVERTQGELLVRGVGHLPDMKQRWFTVATVWNDMWVVGDRCGGLHTFTLQTEGKLLMMQSLPKLHGKMGVTDLKVVNDVLWSAGRDGFLRSYCMVEGDKSVTMLQALHVGYDWVAGISLAWGELAIYVWHGANILMRTVRGNIELGRHECGGGHRSWDITDQDGEGKLVYIKEREVLVGSLWSREKKMLLPGGHIQQVNVVKFVKFGNDQFLVTGGEETIIRIYKVEKVCKEVAVLRGHLSSIKCLAVRDVGEKMLLISGGGRAELRVWGLEIMKKELLCSDLGSSLLRGTDKQKKKPWRLAQQECVVDSETRYLSVDTRWEKEKQKLMIYLACSDGHIRVLSYCTDVKSLEVVRQIEYHTHCVLQVQVVSTMVLTATTGGLLSVWDRKMIATNEKVRPIAEAVLHQSGVNCMSITGLGGEKWLVVTGGDDQNLVLTNLEVTDSGVELHIVWCSDGGVGHTAQLTGVRVIGEWVITTSVDQRVVLWKVGCQEGCQWVVSKCGSVADVADLDCWLEGNRLMCALVGVGMELIALDLPS